MDHIKAIGDERGRLLEKPHRVHEQNCLTQEEIAQLRQRDEHREDADIREENNQLVEDNAQKAKQIRDLWKVINEFAIADQHRQRLLDKRRRARASLRAEYQQGYNNDSKTDDEMESIETVKSEDEDSTTGEEVELPEQSDMLLDGSEQLSVDLGKLRMVKDIGVNGEFTNFDSGDVPVKFCTDAGGYIAQLKSELPGSWHEAIHTSFQCQGTRGTRART